MPEAKIQSIYNSLGAGVRVDEFLPRFPYPGTTDGLLSHTQAVLGPRCVPYTPREVPPHEGTP